MSDDEGEFLVHRDPVWRERSNFIINAELPERDGRFEQLWSRQVSDDTFELCCIPFFLYDVALGDVVRTVPLGGRRYVLAEVVEPSQRFVFRVWFGKSSHPQDEVANELVGLGALLERSSPNLLAVDAADEEIAKAISGLLYEREELGQLEYETGRLA